MISFNALVKKAEACREKTGQYVSVGVMCDAHKSKTKITYAYYDPNGGSHIFNTVQGLQQKMDEVLFPTEDKGVVLKEGKE